MTTSCDFCGVANRANANFCIGCAAKLPGFVATGPSALQALRPAAVPHRARRSRPPDHAAFWRLLLVGGLLCAFGFTAWYLQVTRAPDPAVDTARSAPVVLEPAFQLVGPFEPDAAWLPAVSDATRAAAERTAQWAALRATDTAPPAADAPSALETVTLFYRALSSGDGARAASFVTASKRAEGPLSGEAMSAFYRSLTEPLAIRSVTRLDDQLVEARYTWRASRTVCHGRALVTMESSDRAAAIRSIAANC